MDRHTAFLVVFVVCWGVSVALAVMWFRRVWIHASRLRSAVVNVLLTGSTLALTALVGEAYFYFVNVEPDSYRFTLAHQRWMQLYWRPINSLGYRDDEYTARDVESHRICVVVGDSFAAGSGIADYRDRFANVLAERLGSDWIVPVVANGGWSTEREWQALREYPFEPDVIVLQYYLNDILDAAGSLGHTITPEIERPQGLTGFLTRHSYLFDRLYWMVYRLHLVRSGDRFWDDLRAAYADPEIWARHDEAIRDFCAFAKERDLPLLVLVIPHLERVEQSRPVTERVASAFVEAGVPVLDISPLIADRAPADMVVNPFNAHANEALNQDMGEWLHQEFAKLDWAAPE